METQIGLGVFACFVVLSGGLKVRPRIRQYMGGTGLGAAEATIGCVLLLAQGPNMASDTVRVALGWTALVVMIASNGYAVIKARAVGRARKGSEGHRLYTELKFAEAIERAAAAEDGDEAAEAGGDPSDGKADPA